MDLQAFYSVVAATGFALLGLWWGAVKDRKDVLNDPQKRTAAGGVYFSFLFPAAMSLGAQLGGDNPIFWRSIFIVAGLLGIIYSLRLQSLSPQAARLGITNRNRWLITLLYLIVIIVGFAPQLARNIGLEPLQAEGFALTLLILIGHGMAWELMTGAPTSPVT